MSVFSGKYEFVFVMPQRMGRECLWRKALSFPRRPRRDGWRRCSRPGDTETGAAAFHGGDAKGRHHGAKFRWHSGGRAGDGGFSTPGIAPGRAKGATFADRALFHPCSECGAIARPAGRSQPRRLENRRNGRLESPRYQGRRTELEAALRFSGRNSVSASSSSAQPSVETDFS